MVAPIPQNAPAWDEGWLDLDRVASVEVTSEDADYPIESALLAGEKRGWRATEPGSQTIRLIFDNPQRLRRIWLAFVSLRAITRTSALHSSDRVPTMRPVLVDSDLPEIRSKDFV